MSQDDSKTMPEIGINGPIIEKSIYVLEENDKKNLENQIIGALRNFNKNITKKDILALIHRIEVEKGLDGLRTEILKDKNLFDKEISEEVLQDIMDIVRKIENMAESSIRELKLEITRVNVSKKYTVKDTIYFSSRFSGIKKLENSRLGDNIIVDIAGIGVGALDSIYILLIFLLSIMSDFIMLPNHIIREVYTNVR